VDYEAVDAKVKAYDKQSFRKWREEMQASGEYERTMTRIFNGWDKAPPDQIKPWAEQDEKLIARWLAEG